MDKLLIVGDADSIIAQANPNDKNHKKAVSISEKLINQEAQLIYPTTAVVEAVTFIQRALSSGATAYGTATEFLESNQLVEVTQDMYSNAVNKYYGPRLSKQDTLFDCIVAATAEKYEADAIFSFDKFYKRKGFKLASEL